MKLNEEPVLKLVDMYWKVDLQKCLKNFQICVLEHFCILEK